MFLRLEQDVCMGAGYCAKRSPQLFRITTEGIAALNGATDGSDSVELNESELDEARECVNTCPAGAIDVTDD
jgi:ferredoxin